MKRSTGIHGKHNAKNEKLSIHRNVLGTYSTDVSTTLQILESIMTKTVQLSVSQIAIIADDVARALGDGWTYNNNCTFWSFWLTHPSGKSVFFRHREDKWEASGTIPKDSLKQEAHTNLKCEDIGISVTKSGEQIAKDLRRRLFPSYDLMFADCLENIARREARYANHERVKKLVEEIVGKQFQQSSQPSRCLDSLGFNKHDVTVRGGEIELALNFGENVEEALGVLRYLSEQIG